MKLFIHNFLKLINVVNVDLAALPRGDWLNANLETNYLFVNKCTTGLFAGNSYSYCILDNFCTKVIQIS